jgi:magnesium chelatase family protein
LAIAVSILKTTNQLHAETSDCIFIGELSFNGELRKTTGILPATIAARDLGFKNIFIPEKNKSEASLVEGINIFPATSLTDIFLHLLNEKQIPQLSISSNLTPQFSSFEVDMSFIKGQEHVKRALELAAAGAHNILMSGPPGSGKTLMARALPSILPPLSNDEILEITKIYSIAGLLATDKPIINIRPFRSPHHTSSGVALVGGGKYPRPGEISLAHRGVLFLDELPEFPRLVLENLRQPLEDGIVSISRAQGTLTFPARFTLVASQNPCPCGYASDPDQQCTCSMSQILKYRKKISGPILDRIDLHVEVPRVKFEKLYEDKKAESSKNIRERIMKVTEIQNSRFKDQKIKFNAEMRPEQIKEFCRLDDSSIELLRNAATKLHLSARSHHRILKIARTIADLENEQNILFSHVAEALQYRTKNID